MRKTRIEALKYYAGFLTAIMAFAIFTALMIRFTKKDLLEVLVLYGMFICAPAFSVPFFIAGEGPNDETYDDEDDDY